MAQKTNANQTQKELKLEGVILCQRKMKERKELEERTVPAKDYITKCKAKRVKKEKRKEIIAKPLVQGLSKYKRFFMLLFEIPLFLNYLK